MNTNYKHSGGSPIIIYSRYFKDIDGITFTLTIATIQPATQKKIKFLGNPSMN